MLKDFLIKCSELLNRDDIVQTLREVNDIDSIENAQIKNDVLRLISYYNFTVSTICENYYELTDTQSITSDENKKIYFYRLNFLPIKIISVFDEYDNPVVFDLFNDYILLSESNKNYNIYYAYVPQSIYNLNDEIQIPEYLCIRLVRYGVVSEFLASKNQFNESEFWRTKFMDEIFRTKNRRERRFKSTFCKWNNQINLFYSLISNYHLNRTEYQKMN